MNRFFNRVLTGYALPFGLKLAAFIAAILVGVAVYAINFVGPEDRLVVSAIYSLGALMFGPALISWARDRFVLQRQRINRR